MSEITYFQRYSQRENVVTNNTLLLLHRLYAHSPRHFEKLLADLVEEEAEIVGPRFEQQVGHGGGSIPDGQIFQPSFRIVVETKLGTSASIGQLRGHLEAFGGESTKILLLLMPTAPAGTFSDALQAAVKEYNEEHGGSLLAIALTFNDLISRYGDVLADHDFEMKEILSDYEAFCHDEGLLPRILSRMRAVPCGTTLEENFQFGVYYEPAERFSRDHRFLAIYKNKMIQGVGEVTAIVEADVLNGSVEMVRAESPQTEEDRARILGIVNNARAERGWDISHGHKFFVVDQFHPTKFRKVSPGGMRGQQYFDLSKFLGRDQFDSAAEVADELSEREWE